MRRGKAPATAIAMTELQYQLLEQESRKRTTQSQFQTRINLLLGAHQGTSNMQLARDLGLTRHTVKAWRKRWQSAYDQLCEYEKQMPTQELSNRDYLKVLLDQLRDLPRSGTKKQISLEEEQQIVALASEKPQDHGLEITQWTHEMLAKVAIAKGILKKISSRHVGNILKKTSSSPTKASTGFSLGSKTGRHSHKK